METKLYDEAKEQCVNVLILPMRNGNSGSCNNSLKEVFTVLILPMRNGNFRGMDDSEKIKSVLILPMRNGNVWKSWKL